MLHHTSTHLYFSQKRRIKTVAGRFFRLLTMKNKDAKLVTSESLLSKDSGQIFFAVIVRRL